MGNRLDIDPFPTSHLLTEINMKPLEIITRIRGTASVSYEEIDRDATLQAIIDRVNENSQHIQNLRGGWTDAEIKDAALPCACNLTHAGACTSQCHVYKRFKPNEIWVESEENGYTVRIWRETEAEAQAALELLLNL